MGRLASSAAIRQLGEWGVMVGARIGTAVGIGMMVATPLPAVAAVRLLRVRTFESPVHPVSYSLASRSAPPGSSGQEASLVWTSFSAAFLVGPLIAGFLADWTSLQSALVLFVITSLLIAALAFMFLRGEVVRDETTS